MEAPILIEHPTNQILFRQSSVEIQLFPISDIQDFAPEDAVDNEVTSIVQSCNDSLLKKALKNSAEEPMAVKQDKYLAAHKGIFVLY